LEEGEIETRYPSMKCREIVISTQSKALASKNDDGEFHEENQVCKDLDIELRKVDSEDSRKNEKEDQNDTEQFHLLATPYQKSPSETLHDILTHQMNRVQEEESSCDESVTKVEEDIAENMEDDANWKQVGRTGDLSPKSLKKFVKRGKKADKLRKSITYKSCAKKRDHKQSCYMMMKAIFWNIRSINTQQAFNRLQMLNRHHKYFLIALMEPFQHMRHLRVIKEN